MGAGEMNEKGQEYLSQRGNKGLLLDRKKTDMAHRQMTVHKGKMKTLVLG